MTPIATATSPPIGLMESLHEVRSCWLEVGSSIAVSVRWSERGSRHPPTGRVKGCNRNDDDVGLLRLCLRSPLRLSGMQFVSRQANLRRGTRLGVKGRLGGPEGNEIPTSATAAALTILLIAEGLTILDFGGLRLEHMFIGLVLIPPVLLKLSSTGYRFARYYTGSRPYREKGPPMLLLRALAPVLVVATVVVFATGVWLLLLGHRSDTAITLHKAAFIAFGVVFVIHFLAYLPRMLRSLRADWGASRRQSVPGSSLRAMLLASSLGGGVAVAVA